MKCLVRLLAVAALALSAWGLAAQGYPPSSSAPTQAMGSGVVVRQQVMKNAAVFFTNVDPAAYTAFPPNVWHRVDLKPWGVPRDAPWAFLSGILIITHNLDPAVTANLMVGLRRVGDSETGNCDTTGRYIGQTMAVAAGGGTRSTMASFVPLVDGEFEACWSGNPHSGQYPSVPAMAVNLHVQAWGSP